MKPKVKIISTGSATFVELDGKCIGKGVRAIEFQHTQDREVTIRLDIDLNNFSFMPDGYLDKVESLLNEEFPQKIKMAYNALNGYSRDELIEMRRQLNNWKWPDKLGPPPVENWDDIPHYRWAGVSEGTATKADYIKPYVEAMNLLGVRHCDIL